MLAPAQLDRLLGAVAPRALPGAEITLEANPESLVAEHLSVFAAWGGNRLSLGIQSFDEGLLARHGRPTRSHHIEAARRLVQNWRGSLSLDLICGLEGQTSAGQRRDLETALAWNPDHLSFYSLTVEPHTPLGRRAAFGTAALPAEDDASQWWLAGRDRLEAAGLAQYEVSNFARPGAESVHNGRYWNMEPWWGVGPSAASFLPLPDGHHQYVTQPSSLAEWLANAPAEVETPSQLELAKDRLLSGLRRTIGVPASPWVDLLPHTLSQWEGRIQVTCGQLFLSREAFPFLDAFLRQAFAELDDRPELR